MHDAQGGQRVLRQTPSATTQQSVLVRNVDCGTALNKVSSACEKGKRKRKRQTAEGVTEDVSDVIVM